jgi:hypothetical protein
MEALSFTELLHLDMGAVSKVGPELSDPQTEGRLDIGYCPVPCEGSEDELGMLTGEMVGNKSSSAMVKNSSNGISRPSSPC